MIYESIKIKVTLRALVLKRSVWIPIVIGSV